MQLVYSLGTFALLAQSIYATYVPLAAFPQCAQTCIPKGIAAAGCSGPGDLHCICKSSAFDQSAGACEATTCSKADLSKTFSLAEELCAPVGGLTPAASSIVSSILGSLPPTATATFRAKGHGYTHTSSYASMSRYSLSDGAYYPTGTATGTGTGTGMVYPTGGATGTAGVTVSYTKPSMPSYTNAASAVGGQGGYGAWRQVVGAVVGLVVVWL